MKEKITFGVIVGTRGFFNPELAGEGRKRLLSVLDQEGYNYIILPEDATPTGAVETYEDVQKCARLFHEKKFEIDGIIVSLPNFGDELGIADSLKESGLDVPVLVHAEDDDIDKVDTEHRRDSFCGKLSVCNNLYQYNIPFTDTIEHTCKVDGELFKQDLAFFEKVCRVVGGLRHARIGQVGARPAGFQTVRASEKIFQANGITVVPVDLSEIIGAAQAMGNDAANVKQKEKEIRAYGHIPDSIPAENVIKQAALSVALNNWVEENRIDATAAQCWTSIQENYGCAMCVSMSMMGERLLPSACEVDVGGAISMYALSLASMNPAALLDWNNNYGDDRSKCVCTHCSNYPKSFIGTDVEISNLDILGASLGYDRSFGAVKGKVAAGPMTYFRIDTDDLNGRVRGYLGDAQFTDDPFDMCGGIAVCQVNNLRDLMKYMCAQGFEHHVGMARGHSSAVIEEAVTKYLGWDIYVHK